MNHHSRPEFRNALAAIERSPFFRDWEIDPPTVKEGTFNFVVCASLKKDPTKLAAVRILKNSHAGSLDAKRCAEIIRLLREPAFSSEYFIKPIGDVQPCMLSDGKIQHIEGFFISLWEYCPSSLHDCTFHMNYPLAPTDAMAALVPAAKGLMAVSGIYVHRDIKPGNLMGRHGGPFRIADPDFFKPLGDVHSIRGTPSYMPPEIAKYFDGFSTAVDKARGVAWEVDVQKSNWDSYGLARTYSEIRKGEWHPNDDSLGHLVGWEQGIISRALHSSPDQRCTLREWWCALEEEVRHRNPLGATTVAVNYSLQSVDGIIDAEVPDTTVSWQPADEPEADAWVRISKLVKAQVDALLSEEDLAKESGTDDGIPYLQNLREFCSRSPSFSSSKRRGNAPEWHYMTDAIAYLEVSYRCSLDNGLAAVCRRFARGAERSLEATLTSLRGFQLKSPHRRQSRAGLDAYRIAIYGPSGIGKTAALRHLYSQEDLEQKLCELDGASQVYLELVGLPSPSVEMSSAQRAKMTFPVRFRIRTASRLVKTRWIELLDYPSAILVPGTFADVWIRHVHQNCHASICMLSENSPPEIVERLIEDCRNRRKGNKDAHPVVVLEGDSPLPSRTRKYYRQLQTLRRMGYVETLALPATTGLLPAIAVALQESVYRRSDAIVPRCMTVLELSGAGKNTEAIAFLNEVDAQLVARDPRVSDTLRLTVDQLRMELLAKIERPELSDPPTLPSSQPLLKVKTYSIITALMTLAIAAAILAYWLLT